MSFIQQTYRCYTHDRYCNVALGTFGYGMPYACEKGAVGCAFKFYSDGWSADFGGVLKKEDKLHWENPPNYAAMSHSHCWDQDQPSACGIPLADHKQCCLCSTRYD